MNLVAAYDYWKDADLLIGIGSRLELEYLRWRWVPRDLKVIRIDIIQQKWCASNRMSGS